MRPFLVPATSDAARGRRLRSVGTPEPVEAVGGLVMARMNTDLHMTDDPNDTRKRNPRRHRDALPAVGFRSASNHWLAVSGSVRRSTSYCFRPLRS